MRIRTAPWAFCVLAVGCGSSTLGGSGLTTGSVGEQEEIAGPQGDDGASAADVLVVSRVQYDGNTFGSAETYPTIFNDPSITGIQGSIHLDRYLVAPGVPRIGTRALTGITSSFSSKSEGALTRSVDGRFLTYMGYAGPVGAEGVSNSYSTGANLAGNTSPLFDRVVARISGDGDVVLTSESNAYSGDNPRAAVTIDGDELYMAGNSDSTIAKDGTGPGTTIGVRLGTPGATTSTEVGQYFAADRPDESAKQHVKDNNWRGIGVFGGNLYVAKGSGGNGDDGVFQVHAAAGDGLPTGTGNAITPIFSAPATDPSTQAPSPYTPFGFFFADSATLYVADEGYQDTDASGNLVPDPLAGLEKWRLVDGAWRLQYVLTDGLDLYAPESVDGYPVPTSTTGLRNLTGKVAPDGTVTLYAITAQYSSISSGEPDPTKLVTVTDRLEATTLPREGSRWGKFVTLRHSEAGQVFRGVAFEPRRTRDPIAATKRVLLISVDGLHQTDLDRFIASNPSSTLAELAGKGVEYVEARTTTPSDSFPGTLAFTTGGTPKTTGVYYDDSYDRTLYAPGQGCTGSPGTEAIFDESVDFDSTKLFSGGVNEAYLPHEKDAEGRCKVVHPHDFVKANTVFEVVKSAGGYTAWSDKHPSYEILNGPSGKGLDDLYAPEQASLVSNAPAGTVNGIALGASLALCDGTTNSLPLAKLSDYTSCEPAALAYDDVRVQAIVNQIDGLRSEGSARAPVPTVFGMNFQALSIAQKLPVGGYLDASGAPSPLLAGALGHIDASLGRMVNELERRHLVESTLIIVTAKHGQSPIDRRKLAMEAGGQGAGVVQDPLPFIDAIDANIGSHPSAFVNPNSGNAYDTVGHFQTDDVGILWIQHSLDATSTAAVASALEANAKAIFADALPSGTLFSSSITSGSALAALFGDPTSDDPVAAARAPDVFIQPNAGTIYSGSSKKIAEHGGGTLDDRAVALLVSIPGLRSAQRISEPVTTTQIAPTILRALRLDPASLEAVQKERTQVLPSLF